MLPPFLIPRGPGGPRTALQTPALRIYSGEILRTSCALMQAVSASFPIATRPTGLRVAQALLGHAYVKTTQIHVDAPSLRSRRRPSTPSPSRTAALPRFERGRNRNTEREGFEPSD